MTERNRVSYDACALMAHLSAQPTRVGIERVLEGLQCMEHRTGIVTGESDGVGIMIDLPRALWRERLGTIADSPRFWVAHLFLSRSDAEARLQQAKACLESDGWQVEAIVWHPVNSKVLGPSARAGEPIFVQMAGLLPEGEPNPERALFRHQLRLERELGIHCASFSRWVAVYKVHGCAQTLRTYYHDLQHPNLVSAITLGHSRYSTNTLPAFTRVQPFALLGHNGEINTIDRLRREAQMLGVQITPDGSDSQDLDRLLHALVAEQGLSLWTAMELAFPPIWDEVAQLEPDRQYLYRHLRAYWGPFAQGPAAIIARWGDACCFATDALGLRPLWYVPTEEGVIFTSERASLPMELFTDDPRPLAPGEKMGVVVHRGHALELLSHEQIRERVLEEVRSIPPVGSGVAHPLPASTPNRSEASVKYSLAEAPLGTRLGAYNFCTDDLDYLEHLTEHANEPIGSLGYDGPLAVLHPTGQTLADYCKESVAVVTNPAMDREREAEHFNTQVIVGRRPASLALSERPCWQELTHPFLLSRDRMASWLDESHLQEVSERCEAIFIETLTARYPTIRLPLAQHAETCLEDWLEHLAEEAIRAVEAGAELVVLDDACTFTEGWLPLDPHLAVASLDKALRQQRDPHTGHALRRACSIVLVSEGLRNLHDLVLAFSLGADAFCPSLMLSAGALYDSARAEVAPEIRARRLVNLIKGLCKGLEKVISTMGTHEFRGYGRNFAGIGIAPSLAEILECPTFCAAEQVGLTLSRLESEARQRYEQVRSGESLRERRDPRFYPKVWKIAGQVASGIQPFSAYSQKVLETERDHPVALRHLLELRTDGFFALPPDLVDTSVGHHRYPFHISAMSFGSQGETAFRVYAESARRLGILCINGEGGEIHDMLGRYTPYRGQQVASGRFGVTPEMLNSACVIEIKIGQGAKPGEGGHLPGKKVTPKIARARNAVPGIDLISPSNNHDIYSIEDLAQLIEELKTCNPQARISVKVPVVPNIGTIAVGIAKAGADIINLSGYDGGTGAARTHALKFVGLPAEIGVREAHRALVQAGLRHQVELWADGGLKTGRDVVKMLLLGANRCGFGTLAMVAAGCTICRACQTDTCHVGIATQIESVEEAMQKNLKRFVPRDFNTAVEQLCRFFEGLGEEVRQLTAQLGFMRTQDLVGRCDLLYQAFGHEWVDLSELLEPVAMAPQTYAVTRPESRLHHALHEQVQQAHASVGSVSLRCQLGSRERAVGTALAGDVVRTELYAPERPAPLPETIAFTLNDCVMGNGFGAFNTHRLHLRVYGGAQDGVGKCSFGGRIVVLKGRNRHGKWLDGSVGKGFAYGAQSGLFIVQGYADSRFCIRLSGANVVAGARLTEPIDDRPGVLASRAHLKGFAFEYMTMGTAVVLGDPGPWLCAGMTGGVVYVKLWHEFGFDLAALKRRLSRSAQVGITPVDEVDTQRIRELLEEYRYELLKSGQEQEAEVIAEIAQRADIEFVAIRPVRQQADQTISTE